jgi:SAM-dependent methyltransferase
MTLYDSIGREYGKTRRTDPRIAAVVADAVGVNRTVANIGAGTGSYEPPSTVVAVEPSQIMIDQRPPGMVPVLQATAEQLPLRDACVDVALAVLTIHHWKDVSTGVSEMMRVARKRLVFFTWLKRENHYWLLDEYLPAAARIAEAQAVSLEILSAPSGRVRVVPVPVPFDCIDGFGAAYWRRPEAYLDPNVRGGISMFAKLGEAALEPGLKRLAQDLRDGRWHQEHTDLLGREELDVGLSLVIIDINTSK